MTSNTVASGDACIKTCGSQGFKYANYNERGDGPGADTCQCFDGCEKIEENGVYDIHAVDGSKTCSFCPDNPCELGGGDGESPLIDPWCMPCVTEKIWDFDSWCWKEWDYWCVGHFVEMCEEDTGITCPEGSANRAKEIQQNIQAAISGRLDDPERPVPPPYPSK